MNYNIALISADHAPNQGGIAEYSKNLAETLHLMGNNVKVVAPHVSNDYKDDSESPVEVYRIGELNIMRQRLGLLARKKSNQEFKLQLNEWVESQCKINRFDFAIVSSVSHWADVCIQWGIPFAVCVHGGDALGRRTDFIRSLYRPFLVKKIFRSATIIYANSNYTAKLIKKKYKTRTNTITTYCGISNKFITSSQNLKTSVCKSSGGHRLLMMCRLVSIKACDIVLEVIARLKIKYPNILLTVAGDGPERAALEQQAQRLGIKKQVKFIGYISNLEKKAELFMNNDIFVQSGRYDQKNGIGEALGITFLEAAICSKPVIGPRIGGVPECILHGETGYLVEPNSTDSMLRALDRLLANNRKAVAMGRAGKELVGKKFSYDRIAKTIVKHMELHLMNS